MASDERGFLGRSPRLLCNSSVSVPLCPCCWASTIIPLPTSCLSAPPGVHEQVPLQPGLHACSQSGCGRVGQQSQFVENTSAKVVSNHREAVVGALELVLKLIVEISLLFLGPDHIHDLAVFREAGGAVSVTFRVTLKAVLVEGVAAEKVD